MNAGRPKGKCYPLDALIRTGIYATLKPSEQALVTILDFHTNRDTGMCCPGEALIGKETGLCRTSIWRARKELEDGGVFKFKLAKYNRQGNPVYHYVWNTPFISMGTSLKS